MTPEIEEQQQAFFRDPSNVTAFTTLKQHYEASASWHELAATYERRARYLAEPRHAADLLAHAAEGYQHAGDSDGELRALQKLLDLRPDHEVAGARFKVLARERERWFALVSVCERELEALIAGGADKRRISRVACEAGEIYETRFSHIARAIYCYQTAFKADPGNAQAIEAGRRIYRDLGQWTTVASLYQVELSACSGAKRKTQLLSELGQLLWRRIGNLEAAVQFLEEAARLAPADEEIQEALAAIYASPEWPVPGGLSKACGLFLQMAQARLSKDDREAAITFLRRALGVDPQSELAFSRLERTYQETGRYADLDKLYLQRMGVASEAEARSILLLRGELLETQLGDHKGARECYETLIVNEPPEGPANKRLGKLYLADKDFQKLVDLKTQMLAVESDRLARVRLMLEIAFIHRDKLDDAEAAAELLHQVLELDPENRKALEAYEDYFRKQGDYRNLAELMRFAADAAAESGAPAMEICARLEELADISERHLGDYEAAIEAWKKIAHYHPDVQRTKETLSRLTTAINLWRGTADALEQEIVRAPTAGARLAALRDAARVYLDRKADPVRTTDLLHQALEMAEGDDEATRMLVELHTRLCDDEGAAWALEKRLAGPRTKSERIADLRRLGELYVEKLHRPAEAIRVFEALLETNPTDSTAYDRLIDLLEQAGDISRLVSLLEYQSQVSRSIADRITALTRLAELAEEHLGDLGRAAAYWEELLVHDPAHVNGLRALTRIYEHKARPEPLLQTLERRLELLEENAVAERLAILHKLGAVALNELGQLDKAARAYEELAHELPKDRDVLDALARIYTRLERPSELVAVLERQIELCDDPEQRVVLAFKQGDILEERVGNLEVAAQLYERIISDYAPGDLDAHRKLKHLWVRLGNHRRACEIAERELFITPEESLDRRALSLEIAKLWDQEVGDGARAMLAYERVLETDPDNLSALLALHALYRRHGAFHKLVRIAPTIFAGLDDPEGRAYFLLSVAEVYDKELADPESAFDWYRRVYDLFPGHVDVALQQMERLAIEHGLFNDLVTALLERRAQSADAREYLRLSREAARLCHGELGDPERALRLLREALKFDPTGEVILEELEALADSALKHDELLSIYDYIIDHAEAAERKRDLLQRKARLAANVLHSPAGALEATLRLLMLDPDSQELLERAEDFADESGRWEDVIAVHERRYRLSAQDSARVQILRHVAQLIETELGDQGRAFMLHLQALHIASADPETVANLWRLAALLAPPALGDAAGKAGKNGSRVEDPIVELAIDDDDAIEVLELTEGRPRRHGRDGGGPFKRTQTDSAPPPLPGAKSNAPGASDDTLHTNFMTPPAGGLYPWALFAAAYRSLPARDDSAKIEHLLAAAEIWSAGARDPERAFATLSLAADINIQHPKLAARLAHLAQKQGYLDDVAKLYRRAIDRSASARKQIELHLLAAELLTAGEQHGRAADHWRAILALDPQNEQACEALAAAYRKTERFSELTELLARRLELGQSELGAPEAKRLLIEIADIYQHTLERPFDAAEYLARAFARDPADPALAARLCDLYEKLGVWPKLIDTLERAIQQSQDPDRTMRYLLRVARTYEQEMELAESAIKAYEQVRAIQPLNTVALEGLERLYQAHEQPARLVMVLRAQVQVHENEPVQLRATLVRLARALEGTGEHVEARVCLQRARGLGPRDPDVEEGLARMLVATGRPDEAVQLIESQVTQARDERQPSSAIAPLLVRLARLHDKELGRRHAAQKALEDALAIEPRNPEVLLEVADFFVRHNAWRHYAEVLERLLRVAPRDGQVRARVLDAAELVMAKQGDRQRAEQLLERLLEADPGNLKALDALIELCRAQPEKLEPLLRLKFDLVETQEAKALALTQLGGVMKELGSPHSATAEVYGAALELRPDFVPALDGLSALYVDQKQLPRAQTLLVSAVERLGLSVETGPLLYRLGQVFEQLGQDEEGFRYLLDALRIDGKNLMLRIAVGQNRYRAKRYRDALRHLQELREHPDLSAHPRISAAALYIAGQCEAEFGRDDRAASYFAQALELDPDHQDALATLARLAEKEGDYARAATLLERSLILQRTLEARQALQRRLGALYRDHLHDLDRAVPHYLALLAQLPNDEAARLELLPTILKVLTLAGKHAGAARAAMEMADLVDDPREKCVLLTTAAESWEAVSAPAEAEPIYKRVLAMVPGHAQATIALARLAVNRQAPDQAIAILATFIGSTGEPTNAEESLIRAEAHIRLGTLLRERGDETATINNYQRALELKEDVHIRKLLVDLYGENPAYEGVALENHRRLLEQDGADVRSLSALARASVGSSPYRAYCFYQAIRVLSDLDAQGAEFLEHYHAPELHVDERYPQLVHDDDRFTYVCHPDVQPMREVLATLWEAAPALFTRDLRDHGLDPQARISPLDERNEAKLFGATARALGLKQPALFLRNARGGAARPPLYAICMAPPAVVLDAEFSARASVAELRFLLSYGLELTQPAYMLGTGLERSEFNQLFRSVLRAFHPRHMRGRGPGSEEAMEQASKLRRTLPFKVTRRLGDIFRELKTTQFDSGAWRGAAQKSAYRMGLVLAGDLRGALRMIAELEGIPQTLSLANQIKQSEALSDVLAFAVSDAFYIMRVKLGLAGSG